MAALDAGLRAVTGCRWAKGIIFGSLYILGIYNVEKVVV